jgi:nucleotide-binding universal stress UspA family protein
MLRSLLVALDGSPYSEAAATLAIDWARRHQADLIGLGVVDAPSITAAEPVPLGAGAYKHARDEAGLADAHRQVRHFLAEFRARATRAGVSVELAKDIGDPGSSILRQAQRCDLVVLARETHFHFETQDRPDATLAQVLRGSPRPVVIVPRELPEGEGVLVAYGGGREAARTLQMLQLLGLARGEIIDVVTIRREKAEAEALTRLAGDFLTAHGAAHRLHPIVSDAAAGDALLDAVRRMRPRLVAIGAHGHHPVRDLFATSVTRAVLRACSAPTFVGA